MPCLPGMHAPGSDRAHLLPPAGVSERSDEVYRFHRVAPMYMPDPCIRPTEADLVCEPENNRIKIHPNMPAAGMGIAYESDVFAFHQVRESTATGKKCGQSRRELSLEELCPCTNSSGSPSSKRGPNMPEKAPIFLPFQHAAHHDARAAAQYAREQMAEEYIGNTHVPCGTNNESYRPPNPTPAQAGNAMNPTINSHPQNGYVPPSPMPVHHHNHQHQHHHHHGGKSSEIPNQYEIRGNITHGNDYITTRNAPARRKLPVGEEPDPACPNPYRPAPYVCKPVFHRKYLDDCPEQDGPPADSYTFL